MTSKRKAALASGGAVVLALAVLAAWPHRSMPNVKVHQCPPRRIHWNFLRRSSPVASSDFVELERGACFGECPAYTVTLDGNGAVTWRGSSQVKVVGTATAQIPSSKARQIIGSFRESGFFGLCGNYQRGITDFPTVITRISIAGRTKTVINYALAAPKWLTQLDMKLDRVTDTARWRGDDGVKRDEAVWAYTWEQPE